MTLRRLACWPSRSMPSAKRRADFAGSSGRGVATSFAAEPRRYRVGHEIGGRLPQRDTSRRAEADEVIDRMVQAQKQSSNALLARYAYRKQYNLANVDADLDEALRQSPDSLSVLLPAAARAYTAKDWTEAARLYQAVVRTAPTDRRGYLGLGKVHYDQAQSLQAS